MKEIHVSYVLMVSLAKIINVHHAAQLAINALNAQMKVLAKSVLMLHSLMVQLALLVLIIASLALQLKLVLLANQDIFLKNNCVFRAVAR
jgi:hypothetical protein